jgi:hypothetical protein
MLVLGSFSELYFLPKAQRFWIKDGVAIKIE